MTHQSDLRAQKNASLTNEESAFLAEVTLALAESEGQKIEGATGV
jgi:hypothetical protein